MATLNQKKVARAVVKNLKESKPKTAGQILESIGYSKAIAKNPQMVLNSDGVKSELAKLGFDEDTAKKVVGQILSSEDEEARDRLKAAEMVFKVHGSFAPEKHANLNLNITKEAGDIDLDLLVQEAENKLKEAKLNG